MNDEWDESFCRKCGWLDCECSPVAASRCRWCEWTTVGLSHTACGPDMASKR